MHELYTGAISLCGYAASGLYLRWIHLCHHLKRLLYKVPCHGWDSQNINKYNAWICKLCKTTSDDQPWLFNTRNVQQTGDDRIQPDLEGRRRTEHFEGLPKYGSWVLTRTMACGPSRCGHWLCRLHHALGRRIGSRRNLGSLPYLPFQRPEDMRFFMQDFGSNFLPT